jgi:pimeloyl-ACP methyl ester carboxylesterase
MEQDLRILLGPDGRRLEVVVDGPQDGTAVLFHAGTPCAGRLFAPLVAEGAQRGLRHVTYSRPGYGYSDRRSGRTVADCVGDVAMLADELGIARFITIGWSGGGPHALACAALAPERTLAAAVIGSVAPYNADGLDWLQGMGSENLEEFGAAAAGEAELASYLERQAEGLAGMSAAALHAALGDLVSEPDREVLSEGFAEYMADSMRAAVAPGPWGWYDDDTAFLAPWGFDLARIEVPVAVWHGSEDRFVPFSHGRWLAERVPGAQAMLLDGHGHLSIGVASYGRILDGLLAGAR